ncbi:MAG TPA: dethiobiotin synthase [Actinomycetota bacterium]|nr:dethiobiotin synthase [Actinomycetota bacterium]
MPDLTIVVTGTDTEVGKTWLTVELALALQQRGAEVVIRKPVQSFDPGDRTTDADILAEASGEDPIAVCPGHRRYPLAMAPPMAADALGGPSFRLGDLVDEMDLPNTGVALVEGVGGARSPLAHDGDSVDLAHSLGTDLVVLVAAPGLGAINSVRLASTALDGLRTVVFLNRFNAADTLHAANRNWLTDVDGLDVETSPQKLLSRLDLEDR